MDPAGPLVAIPCAIACALLGWAACVVVRDGWREVRKEFREGLPAEPLPFFLWQCVRLVGAAFLTFAAVLLGSAAVYQWPGTLGG